MSENTHILSKQQLSELIGNQIRLLRTQKGISQAELARLCGKDRQHLELIENNKVTPTLHSIYLICNALNISISELLVVIDFPSKQS